MVISEEERFAALLTEAVHKTKRQQSKPISVIQDELTYAIGREGGNPIEYWRKGNIPKDQQEFAVLTRELVKRGNLDREWVQRLWGCTDFLGVKELQEELFSTQDRDDTLPQKPYSELIGRQEIVDNVISYLRDNTLPIVAIDGMGGIGKTSVAYEVANQCIEENLFEVVVWISDNPKRVGDPPDGGLTYEKILAAIGNGLGNSAIATLAVEQQESRVKNLLRLHKVLVVLDNLETAKISQPELVDTLTDLLGKHSKALMMSRQRFLSNVYHVHLQGLTEEKSIAFIGQEAKERGIRRIESADSTQLLKIASQTGGSPLALKLVTGQLGHHDIDVIMERLRRVQLLSKEKSDEYAQLYKYIFLPSWSILSLDGQKLLLSIVHFAPGRGGTFDAIQATSGLATDILASRIDELWELAFLEIGGGSLERTRYYLHALTQYFVLSDIVKIEV